MANEHKPLTFDLPLRGRIYDTIAVTIGNTPLVRIPNITEQEGIAADICLKLEFFNPLSSVKDRIGVNIILAAEAEGRLKPGGTIIEPTSGNTGIGLAFVAAARGYKLILTMPESMSIERRKMLTHLGAQLELTPREQCRHERAIARGEGTAGGDARRNHGEPVWQSGQPGNPLQNDRRGNLVRHARRGRCDHLRRRYRRDADRCVPRAETAPAQPGRFAVEPAMSPVLSGGQLAPQPIQGIGAGFVPEILDTKAGDEVIQVTNDEPSTGRASWQSSRGFPAASPPAPRWQRR